MSAGEREWFDGLKVGDEVLVRYGSAWSYDWSPARVEKKTACTIMVGGVVFRFGKYGLNGVKPYTESDRSRHEEEQRKARLRARKRTALDELGRVPSEKLTEEMVSALEAVVREASRG